MWAYGLTHSLLGSSVNLMIQLPPTRIEMTLEDVHEYEKAKREADASSDFGKSNF